MITYGLYWKVRNLVESCYVHISGSGAEWIPTEVACPNCGKELLMCTKYDMPTSPMKRTGKCSECEWSGFL